MPKYKVIPDLITFAYNDDFNKEKLSRYPFITIAKNPFDAGCQFLQYAWSCPIEVKGKFTITLLDGDNREIVNTSLMIDAILSDEEIAEISNDVKPEIMMSLNNDGRITMLNSFGHRFFGYPPFSLIGKDWLDLVPEREKEYVKHILSNLNKFNDCFESEHFVSVKSDNEKYIYWNHVVLKSDCGSINGLLSVGQEKCI